MIRRREQLMSQRVQEKNRLEKGLRGMTRESTERLRSKGKPFKVALVAVMRKLLLQLNAVARRGTPWVGNYAPTPQNC